MPLLTEIMRKQVCLTSLQSMFCFKVEACKVDICFSTMLTGNHTLKAGAQQHQQHCAVQKVVFHCNIVTTQPLFPVLERDASQQTPKKTSDPSELSNFHQDAVHILT